MSKYYGNKAKTDRNEEIAKEVLEWREKCKNNPVHDLAEKYNITKARVYKIVKKYEEENK